MPSRMRRALVMLAFFLPGPAGMAAGAAVAVRMSLDDLISSSRLVIYGRVMQTHAEWDPATGAIWTRTEILILDGMVGPAESTLAITEPGGSKDGRLEMYPGTPQFQPGQEVVVFAYRAPGNRWRVTGQLQGVFLVEIDRRSGKRMVRPMAALPETVYEEGSRESKDENLSAADWRSLSRLLYDIRQLAAMR